MTPSAITPHPDAVFTLLDEGSATILHLGTKRYFTLNETGLRIWQLLEQRSSVSEVARQLSREFEVDMATAQERTTSFVQELREHGLVEFQSSE